MSQVHKCYAEILGDCKGPLTKEHYISESVLKVIPGGIKVSGFPWQQPKASTLIGTKTLSSKILCKYHNNALSELDNTGKDFIIYIKKVFDENLNHKIVSDSISIRGDLFELWLLKILCGIVVITDKYNLPTLWIETLFQKKSPENFGMYFFGLPGNASWFFNLIRIYSVKDAIGAIAGAKIGLGGLAILLAFGKPNFEERGMQALYRPAKIVFQNGNFTRTIFFEGDVYKGQGSMCLNIQGILNIPNDNFRPIVSKD